MESSIIKVPAPKEVGEVNCILIKSEKPVLIDPGPNTEEAFDAVLKGLEKSDTDLEDIEKILITHPHSDHFGNAYRIKQSSGAEICMHQEAAEIVENFGEYKERQIKFFSNYFERMGIDGRDLESILEKSLPNSYNTDLNVDRKLQDGDRVDIYGEYIKCLKVEGHAKGSMCFKLESENEVFTGDFILPNITPNPMLMLPESGYQPPSSLELYLSSLKSFDTGDMAGYGGHEGPMEDIEARVEEIIHHHNQRKENIFDELTESMTAFRLMEKFFGELPENQYYLGMAEIISHLKLLEDDGRIKRKEKEGKVIFSRV